MAGTPQQAQLRQLRDLTEGIVVDPVNIAKFRDLLMTRTADLPRRADPLWLRDPCVIGFDTEWDGRDPEHPVLSGQLAAEVDGRLVGAVFEPSTKRLSLTFFAERVMEFTRRHAIRVPRRGGAFHVVGHFLQAEYSMFEDALRDFDIRKYGKAHHASTTSPIRDGDTLWVFHFVDLFAFFPVGLDKIGKSVGLEKIEVPDRSDLATLKRVNPRFFEAYALRDAEVAVRAFSRFRDLILRDFGVDALATPTLPAVGGAIYRYRFLTRPPAPVSIRTDSADHSG